MLTPRFADDDFTRNRQDALDYVTKTLRGNADEDLGKQAMATVMYRGHPYGHPSQGTVAGLTPITLDDVRKLSRVALHARSPDRRRRGRLPRRLRRGVRASGSRRCPPRRRRCRSCRRRPCTRRTSCSSSRRTRAPTPSRSAARSRITRKRPRLLPADGRAFVPGRAPHVQRRADATPARAARAQLRRLRVHRELHPGRLVDVPAAEHPAPPAALRALAAAGAARTTACSRCAPRSTRPTS